MTVRGLQPQPEESLGRTIGQSFGQADRLFEMRDRLIVGGSVQRPVARLDPPFDGRFVEPRLREMMGDDLRLDLGQGLEAIAQGQRDAEQLAALADYRLRVSSQDLLDALRGSDPRAGSGAVIPAVGLIAVSCHCCNDVRTRIHPPNATARCKKYIAFTIDCDSAYAAQIDVGGKATVANVVDFLRAT